VDNPSVAGIGDNGINLNQVISTCRAARLSLELKSVELLLLLFHCLDRPHLSYAILVQRLIVELGENSAALRRFLSLTKN
jgi:hypothetical protein